MGKTGRKFKCSNSDCNETFANQKSRNTHEQTCVMNVVQEEEEEEKEEQEEEQETIEVEMEATTVTQVEVAPLFSGTKRNGDDYNEYDTEEDFSKKVKHEDKMKIRLLLVGRYAGALIGKGGQNFKRLREEYSVKITGLSTQANYRVLWLEGKRENCVSIIKEILPLCPEGPYPAQTQSKCAFELNLLVNTHEVGSIIGTGGSKIKEISEQCGGKIKVYPNCLPNSNERVVSIGGEDEAQIIGTLDTVLDLLVNFPLKYTTVFYDPANISTPQSLVDGLLGQTRPVNDFATVAAILMHNRDNSVRNPDPAVADFGQVQTETTLVIPDSMCGALIGKGGMNLRQVRIWSGANIDFHRIEGSIEHRIMTLSGTQYQIQIAQQLLSQFVGNSRNLHPLQQN